MSVDDYDILSILGNSITSTSYKVKCKKSDKILVWHTFDYEDPMNDKKCMLEKIRNRIDVTHPNILKFHSPIDQQTHKILYIVTDYCENGSLDNIINSCYVNNTYFSEEFVCKMLYQIAFTIKTANSYSGNLTIKNIFLDEDFNIKLFNFELDYKNEILKLKTSHLGFILYTMCTFKTFNDTKYKSELKQVEGKFSHSLLSLIMSLIKDKSELKRSIDKILCHPTVLLKTGQWLRIKSFINIEELEEPDLLSKEVYAQEESIHASKLEKLRKKETSLQFREQQLNEREYKLSVKEKKIILMERAIKEKLQQAELYLKRCKEGKSVGSESTNSNGSVQPQKKVSYENLDSTYVSCEDSILVPTSAKLNVNKIVKPAPFTRTLSERRIRFKGHSPLKEIDFNKRRSLKQSKLHKGILLKKNSEWITCSEDTDKSSIEGKSNQTCSKRRQLFSTKNSYENDYLTNCDMPCKSIVWTEENKKYAYELLRIMNSDKENQCPEVKHTHL